MLFRNKILQLCGRWYFNLFNLASFQSLEILLRGSWFSIALVDVSEELTEISMVWLGFGHIDFMKYIVNWCKNKVSLSHILDKIKPVQSSVLETKWDITKFSITMACSETAHS